MKKTKYLMLLLGSLLTAAVANAQDAADSSHAVKALNELLGICRNVDFNDPKVIELGLFYKAAPYIVYHGTDSARSWKSVANYKNADERKLVDDICLRINGTVNRDIHFSIAKYFTETEAAGTWHLLLVNYDKKGVTKKAVFAFLQIGDQLALGDID